MDNGRCPRTPSPLEPSTSLAGRRGSGRGRTWQARSTCSSSTKRGRCPSRMPSPRPPAPAASSFLGDPQQLDQPLQGVHPPGAERSVLAHVLDNERVMPDHLGLFLDGSWRLHPDISAYTSEVFYEGRLHSHPGRDRLAVEGATAADRCGYPVRACAAQRSVQRVTGRGGGSVRNWYGACWRSRQCTPMPQVRRCRLWRPTC